MRRGGKKLLRGLFPAAALICAAAILWSAVPDPTRDALSWPVSPVLLDRSGALLHVRLSAEGEWCLPVPLSEMG